MQNVNKFFRELIMYLLIIIKSLLFGGAFFYLFFSIGQNELNIRYWSDIGKVVFIILSLLLSMLLIIVYRWTRIKSKNE